jgi:hypothetical protein
MRVELGSWIASHRRGLSRALVPIALLATLAAIVTPLTIGGPSHEPRSMGGRVSFAGLSHGTEAPTLSLPSVAITGPSTTAVDRTTSSAAGATTSTMPPTTTTTTSSCSDTQFVVSVATDRTVYALGQPVYATASWTNIGPTCRGPVSLTVPCAGWLVVDSQGQSVWQVAAATTGAVGLGACAMWKLPDPIPSGYSVPFRLADLQASTPYWNQTQCAVPPAQWDRVGANPNCPDTQVPSGSYTVEISWWPFEASAPIAITGS